VKNYYNLVISVVRSAALMEQLGSYWTDFHEISYLRIFENLLKN